MTGYRTHLKTAVATSAAPYGYTLTIWISGAVTTHARGIPTTWEALLGHALSWGDVDWMRQIIRVRRSYTRGAEGRQSQARSARYRFRISPRGRWRC